MKIVVGLTGASGSILFKRTIEILSAQDHQILVIATDPGRQVFKYELGTSFESFISEFDNVRVEKIDNMFSSAASGSSDYQKMIIVPCSMGTVGNIANGTSSNLLIRAADVFLKEKKPLVLGLRETPLNGIHLKNLETLNNNNAFLVFQVPSFYNKRDNIDDLVDDIVLRNLKYLGIELPKDIQWGSEIE